MSVIDFGMHGNRPYLVMDYATGMTLGELIAKGPVPLAADPDRRGLPAPPRRGGQKILAMQGKVSTFGGTIPSLRFCTSSSTSPRAAG